MFPSSFCKIVSPGSAQWRGGQSTHHGGLFAFEASSLCSFLDLTPQRNRSHPLYPGVHWLKRAQHAISQMYYFSCCGKDHQNWNRVIRGRAETLWGFGSPGLRMSFGSCCVSGAGERSGNAFPCICSQAFYGKKGLSAALLVRSMQFIPGEIHCRAAVAPLPGSSLSVASLLLILHSLIPLPGHPLPWFIYSHLRIYFQVPVVQKGYGLREELRTWAHSNWSPGLSCRQLPQMTTSEQEHSTSAVFQEITRSLSPCEWTLWGEQDILTFGWQY